MRINFNDNSQKPVAFGYNPKLNQELEAVLKSNSGDVFKRVDLLNDLCNETEKEIETNIAKRSSVLEIEPLISFLTGIKASLAETVDELFPTLKFSEKESAHYWKEGRVRSKEWKNNLAEEIKFRTGDLDELEDEEGLEGLGHTCGSSKKDFTSEFMPNDESPKGFSSIGGMETLIKDLNEKIVYPIKNPEEAKLNAIEYGTKFPRATLLYGPPGCGKTFIAEAIAREANVPFFKLKVSIQGSKYINETSQNYEKFFENIAKKSQETGKPCVLFIDELDGLSKQRGSNDDSEDLKQIGTLLDLINNARNRGIIIVGATNKHTLIDEAIKNRFDNQVFVGMPDELTRVEVLKKSLEGRAKASDLLNSKEGLSAVAKKMADFSNRTICDLTEKVTLIARDDGRRQVRKEDYFQVIDKSQHLKIKAGNDDYKAISNRKVGFGEAV